MPLEVVIAGTLLIALTFYVVLGGADFGAGVWTLFARGPDGEAERALIAHAIGPIWEANHVWLILVVTILFTGFPKAFALVTTVLHIPLTLMLIGIVLRGSAFAFDTNDVEPRAGPTEPAQRFWQQVFAVSSLFTPLMLGTTIGAIASGQVQLHEGSFLEVFVQPWWAPFPLSVGVLAVVLFTFLAAIYLVSEARGGSLEDRFRKRAITAALAVAAAAVLVFILARYEAPQIRSGLAHSVLGRLVLALAGLSAGGAIAALWTRRYRLGLVLGVAEASLILWGWALAQYPFLVEPDLTIEQAAAPSVTLRLLLGALLLGAVLLFPSLYYLYRVFKGGVIFGRR